MPLVTDLSETREQRLDEVLANYLKSAQQGQATSRQALLDNHPELANELASFFADQDHVERLATPLRAITPASPPLAAGATLGDYELLDEIAHGGMGVVYRSRQKSLQRIVALKVLQAGPLATTEQAQRFQAEAEAIASLDHPNIVPIYEVGVHEGLPYFSMKLFEGGSLAKVIRDSRSAIHEKEAARMLATVADAVQYAHERGILHRDLKPANILLDAQGQPHVSDFGLAKRTEAARTTRELTLSGVIVGTPSYMAPEQAARAHGVLTTAADVYGLGAILYELLTGRPPSKGVDLFDTLRRLREEEPQPPRSFNPRVDRDLETICLKCLQKEPGRRYAGARELASDLRRYLAGEPIEARPVGRLERLWRWCRRRPFAAGVAAAFVLVIAAAFFLVDQARRRANHSADEKEMANLDLAASRDKGRRAIDDLCLKLSGDGWSEDPATQEKRKQLLEAALRYYRDFLDDPQAEAPARGELVRTYFRIGDVANALGKPDEAMEAFERGRAAAEMVLQIRPDDTAVHTDLARIHNRIGVLHEKSGRSDAALASCTRAYELLAALRRGAPEDVAIFGELAVSCNNLGRQHYHRSQFDAARARYRECIDLNRDLIHRSSDLQYSYALAVTLDNYALLLSGQGQREEAWRCFDEANQLLRRIVAAEPHVPRYRQQLGRNLHNRGNKQRGEKRFADAVTSLKEGCDVLTRLVEMQPRIRWYQEDLARSLHLLGHAYADLGASDKEQLVPAIEAYRLAGETYRQLAKTDPRSADPVYQRACCLFDGAVLLAKRKQTDEMLRAYREARDLDRRLVQAGPDHLDYRKALGMTLNNLGHELWLQKQTDEALAALREALEHNRFALERTRNRSFHRRVLNTTYLFLGEVYRGTGRHDEWAALLRERRALWPDNAGELAVIACDLARAQADDEAVRTLEQAAGQGFRDAARLEHEPALTGLRQRPDFRKLLQEMKEKARPKNGT
jgi:tetratricopeptide (TPR) repeat protein